MLSLVTPIMAAVLWAIRGTLSTFPVCSWNRKDCPPQGWLHWTYTYLLYARYLTFSTPAFKHDGWLLFYIFPANLGGKVGLLSCFWRSQSPDCCVWGKVKLVLKPKYCYWRIGLVFPLLHALLMASLCWVSPCLLFPFILPSWVFVLFLCFPRYLHQWTLSYSLPKFSSLMFNITPFFPPPFPFSIQLALDLQQFI